MSECDRSGRELLQFMSAAGVSDPVQLSCLCLRERLSVSELVRLHRRDSSLQWMFLIEMFGVEQYVNRRKLLLQLQVQLCEWLRNE